MVRRAHTPEHIVVSTHARACGALVMHHRSIYLFCLTPEKRSAYPTHSLSYPPTHCTETIRIFLFVYKKNNQKMT